MSDHDVAARLATAAGELLLGVRAELEDATAAERKAAGDKRSHDFLMEALAAERPADAVLSEEGADNPVRLTAERVWIVDPLDGTREFSELGRDDWAVHVALWQSGELVGLEPGLTGLEWDISGDDVDQRRLAGAIGSDQAVDRSLLGLKIRKDTPTYRAFSGSATESSAVVISVWTVPGSTRPTRTR